MGYPIGLLKRLMSRREFADWVRTYEAEPFNDQRCFDLPAAMLQANYYNTKVRKGAKSFSVDEFMPFQEKPKEPEMDIDTALLMQF